MLFATTKQQQLIAYCALRSNEPICKSWLANEKSELRGAGLSMHTQGREGWKFIVQTYMH